jgi:hypothetical protein
MTSTTLFEITNIDDEEAELYLRSAIEQVAFISYMKVMDISADPHNETRGITAEIKTYEPMLPEYVKGIAALIHVQCPGNKAVKIKYTTNK